ncbi:hypothetical protein [Marinirhabdus gelatinilytica]|uniref:Uncharacterized protein n=1 Tax=Marinirhabdus gelatinilytica TaxID=1703343 RepID=A0A370QJ08_9FLAO|nr:hypothetical protein [Marinirhabdus gelatinilytica]RDK88325.1 hypothetical protein C8D94_101195 [Marinirhabdus gelatinilytica]
MKEEKLKKIVERSEVKTDRYFVDKVMANIENDAIQPKKVKFWSPFQIAIGFVLVAIVSGFLVYNISTAFLLNGNIAIPLVWSIFLLLGLKHLLFVHRWKLYLKANR